MSYTVTIQRVEDGRAVDVPFDSVWGDVDDFRWTEGNLACDCNRAQLVGGDPACGSHRYRVKITLPDGTVPYDEIL